MKRALFGLFLIAQFMPVFAATPAQVQFNEANAAYEKGDFTKAEEIYTLLHNQGYGGAALYYNLGNVAYRKGDRGKAILWYSRAARLMPRDQDVQFNLSLARSHLKDFEMMWARKFIYYISVNELAGIVTLLLWGFLLLFGAMALDWIKAEIWPGMTLWTTGLLLIMFGAWLVTHTVMDLQKHAVIMQGPGEVRNGPGTDYAVGFTVPEGTSVVVLNERPEWTQIGVLNQGLKGWIRATEVERITVSSS